MLLRNSYGKTYSTVVKAEGVLWVSVHRDKTVNLALQRTGTMAQLGATVFTFCLTKQYN